MSTLRRSDTLPDSVLDFLIWHHLGKDRPGATPHALVYRQHMAKELNPSNLFLLIQSYVNRKDLNFSKTRLTMPVLNIVGDHSPHLDATIALNMKLDPGKSTWMKISEVNAGL